MSPFPDNSLTISLEKNPIFESKIHKHAAIACMFLGSLWTLDATAQTGVDDDRVSLPEGPGSLEGVGDNVAIDPNMGSMSFDVPASASPRRGRAPPRSAP